MSPVIGWPLVAALGSPPRWPSFVAFPESRERALHTTVHDITIRHRSDLILSRLLARIEMGQLAGVVDELPRSSPV